MGQPTRGEDKRLSRECSTYASLFAAMKNIAQKTFDFLDHEYLLQDYLHKIQNREHNRTQQNNFLELKKFYRMKA